MTWSEQVQIRRGPTKYELTLGLFSRFPVTFVIEPSGQEIKAVVNGVEAEDGSAESWNIQGYVDDTIGGKFKAYWHTKDQAGHLQLEIREPVAAG